MGKYTLYVVPMPDFPALKRGEFTNKAKAIEAAKEAVRSNPKAWVTDEDGRRVFSAWKSGKDIVTRTAPKPLPKIISSEEVSRLLDACDDSFIGKRNRVALVLMFRCGLRVSDVCNLALDDVDLKTMHITIRHGKGDKERVIPFGIKTKMELESWLETRNNTRLKYSTIWFVVTRDGKQCCPRTFQLVLQELSVKTGIYLKDGERKRNVHPHTLRHVYATDALGKGLNVREVQQILGHANVATTQIYTHVRLPELSKKIQAIEEAEICGTS